MSKEKETVRGLEEELNEALRCNDIMAAALAEIKATNEGKSNQSIKDIINGCISELKNE